MQFEFRDKFVVLLPEMTNSVNEEVRQGHAEQWLNAVKYGLMDCYLLRLLLCKAFSGSHLQHTQSVHPGHTKANCYGNQPLNEVRVSWVFFDRRTGATVERNKPN